MADRMPARFSVQYHFLNALLARIARATGKQKRAHTLRMGGSSCIKPDDTDHDPHHFDHNLGIPYRPQSGIPATSRDSQLPRPGAINNVLRYDSDEWHSHRPFLQQTSSKEYQWKTSADNRDPGNCGSSIHPQNKNHCRY